MIVMSVNATNLTDLQNFTQQDGSKDLLPVYGLPGYRFLLAHTLSITTLAISILISFAVLVYLRPGKTFFNWNIGDRLVVYLGLCDLMYSLNLFTDQVYMVVIRTHVPDIPCAVFAFFMNEFMLGQALLVMFAAVNAFSLVVLKKKLPTGRYDCGLMLYVLATPGAMGIAAGATGYLGPSGAWCYINLRAPHGKLLINIVAILILITVVICICCYTGIWLKLRQVARLQGVNKYTRTARVMILFVAVFILQWWAAVIYGIWGMFGEPHIVIMLTTMTFSNSGGLFNFIAYTVIRRKYQSSTGPSQQDNKTIVSQMV